MASCFRFISFAENTSAALAPRAGTSQPILLLFFLFFLLLNYRKRGSAAYIVREVLSVRERERDTDRQRERDGSDVIIVALELAMNLHFPLPKIRTNGDELTLSLAKNSHFSFLPSHFPSLPSRRGHHGGAEIRNEFTVLSIAKNFFALRLCSPSFKWHEPRDE